MSTARAFFWDGKSVNPQHYIADPKRKCTNCGLPANAATKDAVCPWCALSECRFDRHHKVAKSALREHYKTEHQREVAAHKE